MMNLRCRSAGTTRPGWPRTLLLAMLASGVLAGCNDGGDMVIFSELHGQVLASGVPVAGATVDRSWNWGLTDEKGSDRTVTDSDGQFRLPVVSRRAGLKGLLPHEPFVEQTIRVTHAGQTLDVWMHDRRNYRAGGELGPQAAAEALAVTIVLDAPVAHNGPIYGRATIAPLGAARPAK